MSNLREAAQQALADICAARLCEVNSMSSRQEMLRLMIQAIETLRAALEQPEQEPVAWMHKGTLGFSFSEKQKDVSSIPLYCAPMTMDSDFIQIPVAYQYAYPDGEWRCSYGDPINGSTPVTSRALYARKDGK